MIDQLSIDTLTFAFWSPGPAEMLVLAVVALLLYGGNLPEVARSWGKTFAEFRRGLTGFQSELNEVIYSEPDQLPYHEESEYEARDDSRLADGYEESDPYQDESSNGEETASYKPDEFSPGEPPDEENSTDEANQETVELNEPIDESDQTVRDASAETIVIDPEENKHTGKA